MVVFGAIFLVVGIIIVPVFAVIVVDTVIVNDVIVILVALIVVAVFITINVIGNVIIVGALCLDCCFLMFSSCCSCHAYFTGIMVLTLAVEIMVIVDFSVIVRSFEIVICVCC